MYPIHTLFKYKNNFFIEIRKEQVHHSNAKIKKLNL